MLSATVFEHGEVGYFLRPLESRLERYDIAQEAWQTPINLTGVVGTPKVALVDDDGIYVAFDVAFGNAVYRYNTDGSGRTLLLGVASYVSAIHSDGNLLLIHHGGSQFVSINKSTNTVIDTLDSFYAHTGSSISKEMNRLFTRPTIGSDVRFIAYDDAGLFISEGESPYHFDFPDAETTWVLPGGMKVVDDSGTLYAADNLIRLSNFDTTITDINFLGTDVPIVLSGNKLTTYSPSILPTGSVALGYTPLEIFVNNTDVVTFTVDATSETGFRADTVPLSSFKAPTPGLPVNPVGLAYMPDKVELAADGRVMLFSKSLQSIFLWNPVTQSYDTTIPLIGTPNDMAYSSVTNTIYLAYSTGLIRKIDLANGNLNEVPFATVPYGAYVAAAGQYLIASSNFHYSFAPDGREADIADQFYFSSKNVWSDANQKLYSIREGVSPSDLMWEEINDNGVTYPGESPGGIGRQQDSPLHDSSGFTGPVRVAPDGSIVVLGSGKIHDARTLARLTESLANTITDAAWMGDALFTIRTFAGAAQIQQWIKPSYTVGNVAQTGGSAQALLVIAANRLLAITLDSQGVPQFTVFDQTLAVVDVPLTISVTAIAENLPAGTVVGTLSTGGGGTFTYSLAPGVGEGSNASFTIDGNQVKTTASFDLEAKSSHSIRVRSTNQAGESIERAFSIRVTNVNEPPTITSGGGAQTASISAVENSTTVTKITATDPDAGSILTYSISGGADAAKFTISSTSGVLRFVSGQDFENPADADKNNIYEVEVLVSDDDLTDAQTVSVTVTNGNDAPNITSNGGGTSANIDVPENTTTVTDVDATDVDPQTTLTYSISSGADATFFRIDPTTGVLFFVSPADFENPTDLDEDNTYFLIVTVTDGNLTDTQTIRVTVTNLSNELNNSPRITSNGAGAKVSISVAENIRAVADVNADDDGTAPLSYSISGTDAALFTINPSTGELAFSSPPNFENPADADGNNVYNIVVSVSDGSLQDTQTLTVNVTNVNEPPIFKYGNVAYFLRPDIARLERYDIAQEAWLSSIELTSTAATPTVAHVDADGIYVAFNKALYRYNLDGTGQTFLLDAPGTVNALHTDGNLLFVVYGSGLIRSVNKTTKTVIGDFLDTTSYVGSSISAEQNRIFVRTQNSLPSDIVFISYSDTGMFIGTDDSPYHGSFPNASRTWMFPGGIRVVDDAGVVYATDNLTQLNRFASRIADIEFYGTNIPIVLSGPTVTAYTSGIQPAGSVTLSHAPQDIFVNATDVVAFTPDATSSTGYRTDIIPLTNLDAPAPAQPVDPVGLPFTPDKIELASNGTVLLFSKAHQSIFRWDPATHNFGTTIPLLGTPNIMAYSSVTNTVYLAYSTGLINKIDLGAAQPVEVPFVTLTSAATGMTTAQQYLFVSIGHEHHSFAPNGTLIEAKTSQVYYTSARYVWNEANQKLYFLRAPTSPNDLQWEEFNASGATYPGEPPGGIGRQQDSLLHNSSGFTEPVRVAPDGSVVVLGSGSIHDARTLSRLAESLSNTITDATWIGGELFTIRTTAAAAQIQQWKRSSYVQSKFVPMTGSAHALLSITASRLLAITLDSQGVPQFTVLDQNLDLISPPPPPVSLSANTIAEHSPPGSVVGTLSTASAQTFTYSLVAGTGSRDNGSFTIVGNVLQTSKSFNIEAKSKYTIRVRSTDQTSSNTEQILSVSVTNVNEPPTIMSDGAATVIISAPENTMAVTDVNATDPDAGSILTYSITGGVDAGRFVINAGNGVLTFTTPLDFENPADSDGNNVYEVNIQVSDGEFVASQTLAVSVTNLNEAPVIASNGGADTVSIIIPENSSAVTDVDAVDPDAGTTLTYSKTGGSDSLRFAIDSTTGVLTFLTAPNFEAPTDVGGNNVYDVIVRVSDGNLTDTQTISVTVVNANEAPVITSNGGGATASLSVAENMQTATTVRGTDVDANGPALSYDISGGADAAKFAINATTGVLRLISVPDFENPTDAGNNNVYDVVVRVSDGGLTDTQTIAVTVTNVENEPPRFTKGADIAVTDESPAQSIDGWATNIGAGPAGATDEAGQVLHFVVTNDRNDLFVDQPAVDATGKLTFTPKPNISGSVQVLVVLMDDGGTANGGVDASDAQAFNIVITKAHVWHNAANGLDVSGAEGVPDGHVVAGDALEIINFLNAFGPQHVPTDGWAAGPYLDVNADGSVAPNDALDVINYINAFESGEGETSGSRSTIPNETANLPAISTGQATFDELLGLLALDAASQPKRRR